MFSGLQFTRLSIRSRGIHTYKQNTEAKFSEIKSQKPFDDNLRIVDCGFPRAFNSPEQAARIEQSCKCGK